VHRPRTDSCASTPLTRNVTAPTKFLQTPKENYAYRRFGKESKIPPSGHRLLRDAQRAILIHDQIVPAQGTTQVL
jgi:hypothetical protein